MCLIVDANVAPKSPVQSSEIIDWPFGERGSLRLVAAGKLRQELAENKDVRQQLVQLDRAGRLRSVDAEELRSEEQRLRTSAAKVFTEKARLDATPPNLNPGRVVN